MDRILVIPDVHNRIQEVEKILNRVEFDLLISLGDWFDSFEDTPDMAERTAEYVLDLTRTLGNKFIWLLGNHDVPYVFPELYIQHNCTGSTVEKAERVGNVLNKRLNRDSVKLAYAVTDRSGLDIVFSHAGVSDYHFANPVSGTVSTKKILEKCDHALMEMWLGRDHELLHAGRSRGGRLSVGGITWQDFYYDFDPLPEISQVFGHSHTEEVAVIGKNWDRIWPSDNGDGSVEFNMLFSETININLDTGLKHYMVIEDERITIYETNEKRKRTRGERTKQ